MFDVDWATERGLGLAFVAFHFFCGTGPFFWGVALRFPIMTERSWVGGRSARNSVLSVLSRAFKTGGEQSEEKFSVQASRD